MSGGVRECMTTANHDRAYEAHSHVLTMMGDQITEPLVRTQHVGAPARALSMHISDS